MLVSVLSGRKLVTAAGIASALVLTTLAHSDPALHKKTRDCIAQANTSAQIAGCEHDARKRWQARLANNDQILRFNLNDRLRPLYMESQKAWEHYKKTEFRLIDQTLGKRIDGLAKPLSEGAKTEVIRKRVEQQATLLNSLPFLRGPQANAAPRPVK